MPRWKPNRDEENRLYRKMDEGVSAHGLTFGRPRTLEERLASANQSGRDFSKAQAVKDAAAAEKRSRELFAHDERERLAFLAGFVGEGKRAHPKRPDPPRLGKAGRDMPRRTRGTGRVMTN